ncbi:MAG: hypothetical protein ACI8VW_000764 [bacterium]|jgi:hypothetical protein
MDSNSRAQGVPNDCIPEAAQAQCLTRIILRYSIQPTILITIASDRVGVVRQFYASTALKWKSIRFLRMSEQRFNLLHIESVMENAGHPYLHYD